MAFGIGSLGQIVANFKESLGQIFGLNTATATKSGLAATLVKRQYGGVKAFNAANWLGNTKLTTAKQKLRYGFAIINFSQLETNFKGEDTYVIASENIPSVYYLDIPPQAITQKESFATNITATRKGILVESEGVVFKDITIKGTTGVFPNERGGYAGAQANFSDFTAPPTEPAGVSPDTGLSKKSGITTVSGYQEFIFLRQFFLKYASEKVKSNGDRFLIFINEKDNQDLIVEPIDFIMERNSKRPLEYQYTIVLKCIGIFNGAFAKERATENPLSLLEKIGNVSANLSAGLQQGRAAINATSTAFQRTFQAVDQTINGPLRQLQFTLADLADGISTVASLPETLWRNFTSTIAAIREFGDTTSPTTTYNSAATAKSDAQISSQAATIQAQLASDSRVAVPRDFFADTRDKMRELTDTLSDSFNLSDNFYNQIKGRTVTENPGPLKQVSDEEFLILGNMQSMTDSLNQVLATNDAFQSDVEATYDNATSAFNNSNSTQIDFLNLNKPDTVRQVRILSNDTLERLAQRELKDASRWVEIVILNNLKPPYLDANSGDGIKRYGDTVLIPGT